MPEPELKTGLFKKGESAKEYQERIAPVLSHAQSVAVAKEKENVPLKKRIADIEHLQNGVVREDVYQETLEKYTNLLKDYKAVKSTAAQNIKSIP